MKKILVLFGIILATGLATQVASAQDSNTDNHAVNLNISELALINILSTGASTDITLTPTTSTAGAVPAAANNSTLWLNVTSIVSAAEPTRTINVKTSAVVPGFDLKVVAVGSATGDGVFGTPASVVTLTEGDLALVTGVGSCYTEAGASKGYQLTYSLAVNSGFESIVKFDNPLTVTYTITNN